jgi:rhodanese-related sulfurtransferase
LAPFVKFFIDNWALFLVAITSGGFLLWPMLQKGSGPGRVNVTEAVRLINREKAVLIDVCEAAEYAAGHVPGSRSLPLSTLATATDLPKNKALPVVVVCATGARASRAAGMLKKQGFDQVHTLAGGLAAWREANLPVEKAA